MNKMRCMVLIACGTALQFVGGCFTQQQLLDFARTEFARIVADTTGQAFQLLLEATQSA